MFLQGAYFHILDHNLLCVGVGMRVLKLVPALVSETLVLVPLTQNTGVLIAAVLHELSIEFLPKWDFCGAHTAVTLNETTVSSHSLFHVCPSPPFSPP